VPTAAAIGVAGIGGGLLQAGAAQKASGQQQQAAQEALMMQQGMFNQANNALAPYYGAGAQVLPTLQGLLTPGASQTKTLEQLPGFQFQSQWGDLASTNQLAAQGLGGSGGPLGTALSNYNQGLAGTSFGTLTGMLQNYANMGEGAASSLGGVAANFSGQMGQAIQNYGNAGAAGSLGQANALSGGLGSLGLAGLLAAKGGGGNGLSGIYGGIANAFGAGVPTGAPAGGWS
jgi:hypothetical protein